MLAASRIVAALLIGLAAAQARAFDINGAALGAHEAEIRRVLPSAYCKPLEWKSQAADRRCDDARISFGGAPARVTFYLKADAVRAFDLRFAANDRDKVVKQLKSRWGAPHSETTEAFARRGREDRRVYKARWVKDGEQALLTAPEKQGRATLSAWRGNFDAEIYRVR